MEPELWGSKASNCNSRKHFKLSKLNEISGPVELHRVSQFTSQSKRFIFCSFTYKQEKLKRAQTPQIGSNHNFQLREFEKAHNNLVNDSEELHPTHSESMNSTEMETECSSRRHSYE